MLLSANEGEPEATAVETTPRAGVPTPLLHEAIVSPPWRGRRELKIPRADSAVRDFLDFRQNSSQTEPCVKARGQAITDRGS